ncbi:MAG: nitroreductase/quinone reductase family protein [Gammaproteobacteria bacterium]|nr:nitroreductase/quinone reductase family protein [Gammaproteobacteria bacterium]
MMRHGTFVLLVLLLISGCQTAFLMFPGGELSGQEIHASSFRFAGEFELLQLEVRPVRPYSVWLRVVMNGDNLYIDAAPGRRWLRYLKDNPRVRIKLGDKVYPATATLVTDTDLLTYFLKRRTIYRLDPQ